MSTMAMDTPAPTIPDSTAARRARLWFAAMLAVVIVTSALAWMTVAGTPPGGDETVHYPQVQIFLKGNYYQHPRLVTLPGYHAGMAIFAKVTGADSIDALRLVSLLMAMCVPVVVFAMTRDLPPDVRMMRALQVFFIPVLFPLGPWLYTDPCSLLFVLASLYATTSRQYFWAGLLAIAATMVRQNNVIWLILCHGIGFVREHQWRITFQTVKDYLLRTPTFLLGYALFAAFVILNKGIAMGARENHPSFTFYTGNIALAILMTLVLLLPLHLSRLAEIRAFVSRHAAAALGLIALVAVAHYALFDPSNQWNQTPGMLNDALAWAASSPLHRLIVCLPLVLGVLALLGTRLRVRGMNMLYPATCLFLGSSWLITGRYAIAPLAILMVYANQAPRWAEAATMILLGVFCVLFYTHGFYI